MEGYEALIQALIKDGYLKSHTIIEAFRKFDRKDFLPEQLHPDAYQNVALPIGEGQTISQPLVVGFMLEQLHIKSGDRVLEVGTGTGWKTAIMSSLVGENGQVISIERIASLHTIAKENLERLGLGHITLLHGDGSHGYPEGAPFDKIIAGAAADTLPEVWKAQLKIGGRIVVPVRQSIIVLEKTSKHHFDKKEYFGFNFVPLVRGK